MKIKNGIPHKVIVSRLNAKQIHVFYDYFLNRNPISSLLCTTTFCRLMWVIMYLDAYKEHEKNKEMLITEECSYRYGVCACTLSMYFTIYIFQCAAEKVILCLLLLNVQRMTILLTLHLMHNTMCSFNGLTDRRYL